MADALACDCVDEFVSNSWLGLHSVITEVFTVGSGGETVKVRSRRVGTDSQHTDAMILLVGKHTLEISGSDGNYYVNGEITMLPTSIHGYPITVSAPKVYKDIVTVSFGIRKLQFIVLKGT